MRACSVAGLVGTVATLVLLGCGGAAGGGAEPTTPAAAPMADGTPSGAPGAAPAPSDSAAERGTDATGATAGPGTADTRTVEVIAAVVKTHRKEARDCYEKALKQIPGLKGDVVIHFTLRPNGKVKQAELNQERSTITEASVSSCVIGVVSAIEFPRSSKGKETSVNYPFNFNP
jgi:hypothetical protein